MNTAAAIRTADYHTARRMICANMEAAIKAGSGAIVDVTDRAARHWTVSGAPAEVAKAADIMRAAGLTLDSEAYDEELGETFAYWNA